MTASNNTVFSIPMTTALVVSGFTLCSVSIWYTIDLLRTLGASESEKWLMTVTAIGFETCKFAFIPIAFVFIGHKKKLKGSMVFFLGFSLVGVSMVASLGFLAAKTDQGVELARIESDEYKAGQAKLKTIDKSIQMLSSAAAIDASSQWKQARENASKKVLEIEALEQKRSHTIESMKNIDATSKTDTGALFIALAKGWGMTAEDSKKLCYIVVALLLELCSIATLSLAGIGALKTQENAPLSDKSKPWARKRFSGSFSRSTASVRSASQNAPAASTEATGASVEAALSTSDFEKQSGAEAFIPESASEVIKSSASRNRLKPEAPKLATRTISTQESAPVYNFTEYASERRRAEQEKHAAHQAKVEVLKAQSELARETKAISTEAAKLREGVADQAEALKLIAEQQPKSASIPKTPSQKRSSKAPVKSRSAFDQDLLVRMQHEVKSGQVKGSIRSLQSAYSMGFKKAQMYHERLKQLNIFPEGSSNLAATQA